MKIKNLEKTYGDGHKALHSTDLEVERGEIFALLGPNGAGKTTLISIICGLVEASSGEVFVDGFHIKNNFRKARELIGLVPQELNVDGFETVLNSLRFSRRLFGCPKNDNYLEKLLKDLSLWDKKDSPVIALSGGMKRRVLIGKALAHEPKLLFLDEPTAGVDVALRKEMWALVSRLREAGTTIILTTHYIEEAEEMADRIGVINNGQLLLVEEKEALMKRLGQKSIRIFVDQEIEIIPKVLLEFDVNIDDGALLYKYNTNGERTGLRSLLNAIHDAGLKIQDVETYENNLEDIFVELVGAS